MSRLKAAIESAKRRREAVEGATQAAPAVPLASPREDQRLSIGSVPSVIIDLEAVKANRLLTQDAWHPAETAYRMLRTRLMHKMRANGWRIIGVSSIGQNEGKTFIAINLAISIAAEVGQEAVLVDLDLRRPSIHDYLGIDPRQFTSLSSYFEGTTDDLAGLLVRPAIDRLGCLLTATALERPSDVLAAPRGKRLFDELRSRLRPETAVIVDLPPLLAADDALAVAPMLDGLLLVVAEGEAKRSDIAEARQLLQEFNLVGTVLNKSVEKDTRKSYYG